MSILLSCQNVTKTFGHDPLFSGITFGISEGDRLGILGLNGSGKSTLLKILAGEIDTDEGNVSRRRGLKLVYITQDSIFPAKQTVKDALTKASNSDHHASENPYEQEVLILKIIAQVGFKDPDQLASNLSGGWRKRLAIACALIQKPELLLLDEPTNHLDMEGIVWLENLLKTGSFTYVLISHDRYFLENVSTRTLELNRIYPGGFFEASGSYLAFLTLKEEFISGQLNQQASLANKVKREVEWLRQGVQARTTKQQARIQNAEKLQTNLKALNSRLQQGKVEIDFSSSLRKTKKLVFLEEVSKSLGERCLIKDLTLTLTPGMRLGLLGANASGKTTLLKILAGKLNVDSGKKETADRLKIVYFEQNRDLLNKNITLRKTLAPDGDSVIYNNQSINVASWIRKFLFRNEQLDVPVGKLSGGEQARVLIAKLMLEPADLLLLDEPTNDLDIPTLEVFEDSLTEFPGAIVLVTHDRFMLDRVSNQILALDGKGGVESFADCAQWLEFQSSSSKGKASAQRNTPSEENKSNNKTGVVSGTSPEAQKALERQAQRELEKLEAKIAKKEEELVASHLRIAELEAAQDYGKITTEYGVAEKIQKEIDELYGKLT